MKIFCESVFSDIMPQIRAILANKLLNKYKMSQSEISKRLGITQPAVSQYQNGVRGRNVKQLLANKMLMNWLDKLAAEIATSDAKLYEKTCEICKEARKDMTASSKDKKILCLMEMKK